jgi:hypothetical protein
MPATVKLLEAIGVDVEPLSAIATSPVVGGGRQVGLLQATDFLNQPSVPVNEAL